MRNYRKEYDNYHAKPKQRENNNSRKRARYALEKAGKVSKGDGKDVTHRNGNPKDNKSGNLGVASKSNNRSFPRTKSARKVNKGD